MIYSAKEAISPHPPVAPDPLPFSTSPPDVDLSPIKSVILMFDFVCVFIFFLYFSSSPLDDDVSCATFLILSL